MDKVLKHMNSENRAAAGKQGGATVGGPKSAKDPPDKGDVSSRFTSQDKSLDEGPGTKNPHLPV